MIQGLYRGDSLECNGCPCEHKAYHFCKELDETKDVDYEKKMTPPDGRRLDCPIPRGREDRKV